MKVSKFLKFEFYFALNFYYIAGAWLRKKATKLQKKVITDSETDYSKPSKKKPKPEDENEQEMKDIWYALDYQDRRINKLIDENQDYKDRLKFTEKRLEVEVKDVKKQIQGIKTNLESIVDIVKVSI
jgi:hypothetical protein